MLSIKITGIRRLVGGLEREKDRFIDGLTNELLVEARKHTPIDKGQARRGWRKEKSFRQTSIVNRVPHIEALENGHSKQAPNGITKPAIREALRKTQLVGIRRY